MAKRPSRKRRKQIVPSSHLRDVTGDLTSESQTVYLPDEPTVSHQEIKLIWEHAKQNSKRVLEFILSCGPTIDSDDMELLSLVREMLTNIRYEEKVVYYGPKGNSKVFPCLVVKETIHGEQNSDTFFNLTYLPLDLEGDGRADGIPGQESINMVTLIPKDLDGSPYNCIKLTQPTNELALCCLLHEAVDIITKSNIPAWVAIGWESMLHIDIPFVEKLELYIPSHIDATPELLAKIRSIYLDRYDRIEIAHFNEELGDFEWFLDGGKMPEDMDPDYHVEDDDPVTSFDQSVDDAEDIDDEVVSKLEEDADEEPEVDDYELGDEEDEVDEPEDGDDSEASDVPSRNKKRYTKEAIGQVSKTFEDYLETTEIPARYIVRRSGVWVVAVNDQGKTQHVRIANSGIMVASIVRTQDGTNYMFQILWIDRDGKFQEGLFPVESIKSTKDSISILENRGCDFVFGMEKEIKKFISKSKPTEKGLLIEQTGWHKDPDGTTYFALPNEIIGSNIGEKIHFSYDKNVTGIGKKWSLAEWQERVAKPLRGNPFPIFAVSMAFASPLLDIVGGETGGIHLPGDSTKGKTTCLQIAASVWGNGAVSSNNPGEDFIKTWNATLSSLEGVAAASNNILLCLDELGQGDSKVLNKVVYNLSSGAGKQRMRQKGSNAKVKQWSMLYLSSGEVTVRELLEQFNTAAKAGQLLRLIDVEAPNGIIIDTHGEPADKFVDKLKQNCGTYYGCAGPAYIAKLINTLDTDKGRKELEDAYSNCVEILSPPNLEAQQKRAVKRFALILLGGIYASEYGILPLTVEEITSAITDICTNWIESADHLSDTHRAVQSIRDYISANDARFCDLENYDKALASTVGYKKNVHGRTYYLFPKEIFRKAIKVSNERAVLSRLSHEGLLFKNNGEGRNQARFAVNPTDNHKLPFYAISADILGDSPDLENDKPVRRI